MTKRFGFTLAEVLITLGIIGVVAAMTIPTLMNSTGQAEFKTGFKKAISSLNQAITMNVALESTDFSNLTTGTTSTSGSVLTMFVNRMNLVKTTTAADTELDPTGTVASVSSASNYTLYFNDGMVFSFPAAATSCTTTTYSANCIAIVDVNGVKKPNRLSNCSGSVTATADNAASTCSTTNVIIGDRFSVRFGGQQVTPNGNASRYILYN